LLGIIAICLSSLGAGLPQPSQQAAHGLIEFQKKASPPPLSWGIQNGALALVYSNRELSLVLKSWLRVKAV